MTSDEIQAICDKLRELYKILDKKIKIPDLNLVYEKTISKDGVSIGGIHTVTPDEKGNVTLGFAMIEEERHKGNGTNILALIFCNPKTIKILGMALDRSDDFYKRIGVNIDNEGNFEIIREDFFKNNINRIQSSLINKIKKKNH